MRSAGSFFVCGFLLVSVFFSACTQIEMPKPEPFYAQTAPPKVQELRWSNGKMPKSFDPARAASAPETDIVRAVFEGLTEIDQKTLKETPAAAEKWSSTPDLKTWTFEIRKDAKWSNGKKVTADDFVTSWKRLVDLGTKTAHAELFRNIVGMHDPKLAPEPATGESVEFGHLPTTVDSKPVDTQNPNSALRLQLPRISEAAPKPQPENAPVEKIDKKEKASAKSPVEEFGVEALSDTTLRVRLEQPDKDFPKLVANPIFRPIYGDGSEFETDPLDDSLVTNGAFDVASVGKDGIVLDRSDTYWNKAAVSLEHVRFIPKESAEAALDSYKKGELDAVTNVDFEPLALKLLAPYQDFRQTTHSAINVYEINSKNAPFSDRRVRSALAMSIDRERLTDRDLEGSTQPATSFLPLSDVAKTKLSLDVETARKLLENAGFANGQGFPKIRLLVNRNDVQLRVAKTVARMWKQNLNLETEIISKDAADLDATRAAGEYDLVRRGIVLPTVDELVNLSAIFGTRKKPLEPTSSPVPSEIGKSIQATPTPTPAPLRSHESGPSAGDPTISDETIGRPSAESEATFNEEDAMYELYAIPLYFPTSYSLVKPYVKGFETNGLDAPLLKEISIDSDWQPRAARGES